MAKKSAVAKQARRQRNVNLKFERRQELKKIIKHPDTPEEQRELAVDALNKLSPNSSTVRLRNRCQLTGRPRGHLRKFKLSRICFREMASHGLIPGVTKASW